MGRHGSFSLTPLINEAPVPFSCTRYENPKQLRLFRTHMLHDCHDCHDSLAGGTNGICFLLEGKCY